MKRLVFASVALIITLGGCSIPQPTGYIYYIAPCGQDTQIIRCTAAEGKTIGVYNSKFREEKLGFFKGELLALVRANDSLAVFRVNPQNGEMAIIEDKSIVAAAFSSIVKSGGWEAWESSGLVYWRPQPGAEPVIINSQEKATQKPALSMQAGIIAYPATMPGSEKSCIIVKSLPGGIVEAIFKTDGHCVAPVIFPDGFWVAFQVGDGDASEIAIGYIPDGSIRTIAKGRNPIWMEL